MAEWTTEAVENCLVPLSLRTAAKLQTQDYRASGLYPIVDQGQALIAGWTDDDSGLISTDLPVVVFGDHTRTFKYVNFPFVRGADGTQILKPKAGIDPLFFYYACRATDLPSRGYNRHFSALKEKEIPIPSAEEQRDISLALQQVDNVLSLQDEELHTLETAKRAAMLELFTRGLRGEAQKGTEIGLVPESWDVVPLGSLGRVGNGSTPKKSVSEYWDGGTFPWLTSAKVYDRDIDIADQFVTATALRECHLPQIEPGAILIAITGQGKTLGHCAVLRMRATVSQHVGYVATDLERADPSFIRGYLETQYDYFRHVGAGGGSTKGALTCAFLRGVQVPLPPTLDEQREVVAILDAIDRKIAVHRRKRATLDALFKSLLHKLVTGAILVANLELSALAPELTAEVAE